jgi:hypothetical protein
MFTPGARSTPAEVVQIPHIPKLRENNVRTGYFEYEEFAKLRDELPEYIRPVLNDGVLHRNEKGRDPVFDVEAGKRL